MKSAIALGNFDGVHKAHAEVIKKACDAAHKNGAECVVYTFDTHPQNILCKDNIVKSLIQNDMKEEIILSLGADRVYFEKTTPEFLTLSPEAFISYITQKFSPVFVVAGYNYRFGCKGSGDTDSLRRLGEKYGFETLIADEVRIDSQEVSSSVIRKLLQCGDIRRANSLLTREYAIRGEVVHGKHLGKSLGFPTANVLFPAGALIPKRGVYKSRTQVGGKLYDSITNIGSNPTVEDAPTRAETFISGIDSDIYGECITVSLTDRIRDEKRFESIDALCAQIKKDAEFAFQGGAYE